MDYFCTIEKNIVIYEEKEKVFYVDKYKPRVLEDFIINSEIAIKLNNFLKVVDENTQEVKMDIMNLFLYGTKDSGKYCLARFYIETYFNNPCILSEKIFTCDGKELIYYQSYHHYELIVDSHNCNIINLVKKFLEKIIRLNTTLAFNNYKNVILIKNIEYLKNDVRGLLKFYLDKHYNNIFILIGKNSIINLDSFFTSIRVSLPNETTITKHLKKIIKNEGIKVKKKELTYIIQKGDSYIFKTVCLLENCFISGKFEEYYNSNDKSLGYIYKLIKNPSINGMIQIREHINQLLVNNMTLKNIVYYFYKKIKSDNKIYESDKMICLKYLIECEHNFKKGYREIHHLEYCIIKLINYLKNRWLEK
jgi:DNA polymerase III delta prime subunit